MSTYSSDAPISNSVDDQFDRWQFSKRIADVIANRVDSSSIVVGLYGAWGNGKTSVLNFVEQALNDNPDVICIKFNPWRFGSEDELLKAFFFDIAYAIDAELITKSDKVKGLAKAISPAITSMFGSSEIGQAISGFIPTLELEKLKDRIELELENAQKRVLILIDDVDRLEKTEIHALFRLVKLTADFKYTAYILAFDKDIVASSLQERYSNFSANAGEAFLEKIIQVPLHLPLIDPSVLIQFCFQSVDEALKVAEIEITREQAQNFASKFTRYFSKAITTPRKAKLYGNILLFSLPILRGEVNVVEFLLIEAIRVFYPPVFELLRTNKERFSGALSEGSYSNHETQKDTNKQLIEESINLCQNVDKENVIQLLKDLFPKIESCYRNIHYGSDWYSIWDQKQRVCAPNYYSRYFTYSIGQQDISDLTITNILDYCAKWKNSDPTLNPLNDILTPKNAEKLISKLRTKSGQLTTEQSKALMLAIAQKSDQLPYQLQLFDWNSPIIQGAMLIADLVQNLPKLERVKTLEHAIDNSASLDFIFDILRWVRTDDSSSTDNNDALSENDIAQLSQYTADIIQKAMKEYENIVNLGSRNLHFLFRLLNDNLHQNFTTEYLENILPKHPESMIPIFKSYLGNAEGGNRSIPHKSNLKIENYNAIIKQIKLELLIQTIEQNFDLNTLYSKDYPEQDDYLEEEDLIFIRQFYWLYKNSTENLKS